jgi:hypothetical protein
MDFYSADLRQQEQALNASANTIPSSFEYFLDTENEHTSYPPQKTSHPSQRDRELEAGRNVEDNHAGRIGFIMASQKGKRARPGSEELSIPPALRNKVIGLLFGASLEQFQAIERYLESPNQTSIVGKGFDTLGSQCISPSTENEAIYATHISTYDSTSRSVQAPGLQGFNDTTPPLQNQPQARGSHVGAYRPVPSEETEFGYLIGPELVKDSIGNDFGQVVESAAINGDKIHPASQHLQNARKSVARSIAEPHVSMLQQTSAAKLDRHLVKTPTTWSSHMDYQLNTLNDGIVGNRESILSTRSSASYSTDQSRTSTLSSASSFGTDPRHRSDKPLPSEPGVAHLSLPPRWRPPNRHGVSKSQTVSGGLLPVTPAPQPSGSSSLRSSLPPTPYPPGHARPHKTNSLTYSAFSATPTAPANERSRFECPSCPQTFVRSTDRDRHQKSIHNPQQMYTCRIDTCHDNCDDPCKEKYHRQPYQHARKDHVQRHLQTKHPHIDPSTISESWLWDYVHHPYGWDCGFCNQFLGKYEGNEDAFNNHVCPPTPAATSNDPIADQTSGRYGITNSLNRFSMEEKKNERAGDEDPNFVPDGKKAHGKDEDAALHWG